ncbi:hypothetical protein ACSV4D_09305 [Flavobacterium sp. ARAG 55.4]|uniref:hypothetical protein n=1 Tax=Flavobacterium sp. ARAG 55.4 TaxID=3451357 RepID=UPI003F44791F
MKTTKPTQENTVEYLMDCLQSTETKEDFLLLFWIHWVENVTIRTRDFQNVLASSSVNKWFLFELAKEENEFRILAARYVEIKGKDRDRLYCDCINKMMSKFPKALLDQAQKREVKPQYTKVNGIHIESPIINLN